MKKLILFLFIGMLSATTSFAQSDEVKLSPENEKKSVDMSRELANSLQLNEPEYIKLKALNRQRLAKEAAATKEFGNSPEKYGNRMKEIEEEFEAKLIEFLTPSQKKAFAMQKELQDSGYIVITTEE